MLRFLGRHLGLAPWKMEEKTFAVVYPIPDPSIKGERQILEWDGSPLPPACFAFTEGASFT